MAIFIDPGHIRVSPADSWEVLPTLTLWAGGHPVHIIPLRAGWTERRILDTLTEAVKTAQRLAFAGAVTCDTCGKTVGLREADTEHPCLECAGK